jgi:hypothetical protein
MARGGRTDTSRMAVLVATPISLGISIAPSQQSREQVYLTLSRSQFRRTPVLSNRGCNC